MTQLDHQGIYAPSSQTCKSAWNTCTYMYGKINVVSQLIQVQYITALTFMFWQTNPRFVFIKLLNYIYICIYHLTNKNTKHTLKLLRVLEHMTCIRKIHPFIWLDLEKIIIKANALFQQICKFPFDAPIKTLQNFRHVHVTSKKVN